MSISDLKKFLIKIDQLNLIVELIEKDISKKEALIKCSTHEEVIELTNSWGFQISSRWGES
tara:strand:- start:182 stop:364 length:183 start_codon:yes stop_codon:yes gene_type:complete